MSDHEPAWVNDVLHFWFEELAAADWFMRKDAIDDRVRRRFLSLHGHLTADGGVPPTSSPRMLLAAVLVLDQFSRNLYRDDPRAFDADADARHLARSIVQQGLDVAMTPAQRLFAYLPFEHSENASDQALAVRLIGQLHNDEWTKYAAAHQAAIARFGRFPLRNSALGRTSTADEITYLRELTQA